MITKFRLSPAFCVENSVVILSEETIDSKYILTIGLKESCLNETRIKIEKTFYRRIDKNKGTLDFKQISNDEYDRLIAKLYASSTKKDESKKQEQIKAAQENAKNPIYLIIDAM